MKIDGGHYNGLLKKCCFSAVQHRKCMYLYSTEESCSITHSHFFSLRHAGGQTPEQLAQAARQWAALPKQV